MIKITPVPYIILTKVIIKMICHKKPKENERAGTYQ